MGTRSAQRSKHDLFTNTLLVSAKVVRLSDIPAPRFLEDSSPSSLVSAPTVYRSARLMIVVVFFF